MMTRHIVMYSTGIGSWASAHRVVTKFGADSVTLLFCDVKGNNNNPHLGEDADNYRFLKESSDRFGCELVWLKSDKSIWDIYRDVRFLGNSKVAPCSHKLKQQPARAWIDSNCDPANTVIYVGIDWTESHRIAAVERNYAPFTVAAPMLEPPLLDKQDMLNLCREWGVNPPQMYESKYPHANCGGFCVRAGQAQFRQLLRENRERYLFHEQQEQQLRHYLQKDVSILKDRAGGTPVPLTLKTFRERLDQQPALFDTDDWGGCGCFVDGDGSD